MPLKRRILRISTDNLDDINPKQIGFEIGNESYFKLKHFDNQVFWGGKDSNDTPNLYRFICYDSIARIDCLYCNSNRIIISHTEGSNLEPDEESGTSATTRSENTINIGFGSGMRDTDNNLTSHNNSIFIGRDSGRYSESGTDSISIGDESGKNANGCHISNFIGYQAGKDSSGCNNSNFIGDKAGSNAATCNMSNFIGDEAGKDSSGCNNSNFIGYQAGRNADGCNNSNFIGYQAGISAVDCNSSNFIGDQAGISAVDCNSSNFIGYRAGRNANDCEHSIFIGYGVGEDATSEDSNYLKIGYYDTGSSVTRLIVDADMSKGRFGINDILNLNPISQPPTSAAELGDVIFNNDTSAINYFDGSSWVVLE